MDDAEHALGGRPRSAFDVRRTFADNDQLVRREFPERLSCATRPADFQVRCIRGSEPEMQAGIIARVVTRLTDHFLNLLLVSVTQQHPGADGATIRLCTGQLHLEPVIIAADVVPQ